MILFWFLCNATMMVDLQLTFFKGVGCPTVEQESVEQPLVSKNVGGGCSVSSPAYPSYTATWRPSAQPNSFAVVNSPGWRIVTMVMILMVVKSKIRIALIFNNMWAGCHMILSPWFSSMISPSSWQWWIDDVLKRWQRQQSKETT